MPHYRNVARALSRAGLVNVVPIPSANVPIGKPRLISPLPKTNSFSPVKFKDPSTGIECDINVNDQLGFINTSMMKHYVSLQLGLISLLRLIKRWAGGARLNSPSKQPVSFSSYTLTLMTIAWFQVRSLIWELWFTSAESRPSHWDGFRISRRTRPRRAFPPQTTFG